jgi:hypothetical protein
VLDSAAVHGIELTGEAKALTSVATRRRPGVCRGMLGEMWVTVVVRILIAPLMDRAARKR